MCPAQDHFICLTLLIMYMTFVLSLTHVLVFLSLYVMLSILLYGLSIETKGFDANSYWSKISNIEAWSHDSRCLLDASLKAIGYVSNNAVKVTHSFHTWRKCVTSRGLTLRKCMLPTEVAMDSYSLNDLCITRRELILR